MLDLACGLASGLWLERLLAISPLKPSTALMETEGRASQRTKAWSSYVKLTISSTIQLGVCYYRCASAESRSCAGPLRKSAESLQRWGDRY